MTKFRRYIINPYPISYLSYISVRVCIENVERTLDFIALKSTVWNKKSAYQNLDDPATVRINIK